jgi:signal transduction histidine kinase
VGEIIELIDGTIQDTRSMVSELGSPILYELGLVPAVEWLTQQAENKHNFKAEFKDDGNPKPVSDEVQVFLFQAVRELLANVAKHAKATNCTVSLKVKGGDIRVDVVDDGIGFDEKAVGRNPEKGTGFGFFSIRERLEHLGGSLGIYSKPGEGARLTLIAPLSQPL